MDVTITARPTPQPAAAQPAAPRPATTRCRHRRLTGLAGGALLAGLAACGPAPAPQGIDDPNEAVNRQVHDFNRGLDRTLLRPFSQGYGSVIPEPVQIGVSNVAGNLDLPGDVVNGLLQGRPGNAVENTLRFVVNTTVGIGGLFDPARAIGLPGKSTDFGETLHVWGMAEGEYGEVPFMGPTTGRDLIGTIVDTVANPLSLALGPPESGWATGLHIASRLGDRSRYSDTVDSVLYDSADSYAQTRLLYLQNRRYQLGQDAADDTGFEDPYADPYEDPYAE